MKRINTRPGSTILARDVMSTPVRVVGPDASAREAADMMRRERILHLVVAGSAGRIVGVLTDRDLRGAQPSRLLINDERMREKALAVMHVSDVMTRDPETVAVDRPVRTALRIMRERKIGCLPVVDAQQKPVGIITGFDIVELALHLVEENGQ